MKRKSGVLMFDFKVFHLVSLEALCLTKIPKMVKDIICPTYNVATVEKSATVIEGVRYDFFVH